jgi:hypothetical protein
MKEVSTVLQYSKKTAKRLDVVTRANEKAKEKQNTGSWVRCSRVGPFSMEGVTIGVTLASHFISLSTLKNSHICTKVLRPFFTRINLYILV